MFYIDIITTKYDENNKTKRLDEVNGGYKLSLKEMRFFFSNTTHLIKGVIGPLCHIKPKEYDSLSSLRNRSSL